ncbi:uroporphyrinogen decarboxylase family protein [Clostridium argentinense CDC 2741]|uniref:Uroporphyrinogen decarboxylase family protein n=1 Tax=Clostridium argentinense CDC 2741 TaxID=1418104 RepID=A0A0C1QYU0_9CLOT|nr:uroporphyrinogen decarboxylase family protein [Clostridium argentinense]ARC86058.1 uroporphyrinogen decarboxylase [Clostridium argentinense]KIE46227.1 uroporphyrinogen decarboxylase family protein [Clostridium argentinense CDC 2741]NFF38998.1 uroporphyrinogen decarboxylase [Clostridium argentinense]NFP48790.1 uroporphyrinogen decarboxylase [Clostridium argentinense]NFP70942.1 uroporphyrinogen decarboxylase [Clostridium argentinense]
MFNKDSMTPVERGAAIAKGMEVDRLPCNPNIANGVARIYGCKISEFNYNPKAIAEAQMATYRKFGCDSLRIFTDLFTWAEAMGATVIFPDDDTADLAKSAIFSVKDIDTLRPANPYKDGRLPVHLDAMKYLQELAKDEIKCSAGIVGPFTNAFFLFGINETLKLIHKNPEALHKLCRVSLETCKAYAKAAIDIGLSPTISEPMSSCTVISPKDFREFSLPYLKELIDYIKGYGSNVVVHICGQTDKIWKDIGDLGVGGMSIDNIASLKDCKNAIGSQTKILGNVDPAGIMYSGTPKDVRIKTLEGILDAYDSPKGYVVMSGCSLPVETPFENIETMMNTVREVGYPVRPERVKELLDRYSK